MAANTKKNDMSRRDYHVPNLDRALCIMEKLAEAPRGLNRNEIAAATGCSPNMVYRIMMTLTDAGWSYRNADTGVYRLSRRLLDLAVAGSDEYSLSAAAWPEMCALRDETGVTVMLGTITSSGEGLLLETAESRAPLRFSVDRGFRTSDLHGGAGWKSIMAFLPEDERDSLLGRLSYRRVTATTITSRAALEKALERVRTRGYAEDDGELTEGVHCLAAPIFDRTGRPVGTLSLSAPAEQLPVRDFGKRARAVMAACAAVSAKLGWNNKKRG